MGLSLQIAISVATRAYLHNKDNQRFIFNNVDYWPAADANTIELFIAHKLSVSLWTWIIG
jgi:hypothetical protein